MSIEREVTTTKGTEVALTEEKIKETETQKRARFARVLERGFVVDRTSVVLPPHLHGEWVSKDPMDIERKKALGYWVDEEHAIRRSLHSDGSGGKEAKSGPSFVGDTVYMVCQKEDFDLMEQIRQENYDKANGKPGETHGTQKEEKEFKNRIERSDVPTPIIEESKERVARKAELEAALKP